MHKIYLTVLILAWRSNSKAKLKVLCIFARTLGNKVFSNQLEKTLRGMNYIDPTFLYFDWEDYGLPKIYEISAALEGVMIVKYKYKMS